MRPVGKLVPFRALCLLALGFSAACVSDDETGEELGNDDGGAPAITTPVDAGGAQSVDGQAPEGGSAAPTPGLADAGPDAARPVDGGGAPPDAAMGGGDAQVPAGDTNAVPAGAHCDPVRAWSSESAQFEEEVLALTNAARAVARTCGGASYPAVKPLTMQSNLRCAARLHSAYMAKTGDFSHTQSANGSTYSSRVTAAGYTWTTVAENIAAGQRTPKEVVDGWLKSEGHCKNIMNGTVTQIGVGYVVGSGSGRSMAYWTQSFAKPR